MHIYTLKSITRKRAKASRGAPARRACCCSSHLGISGGAQPGSALVSRGISGGAQTSSAPASQGFLGAHSLVQSRHPGGFLGVHSPIQPQCPRAPRCLVLRQERCSTSTLRGTDMGKRRSCCIGEIEQDEGIYLRRQGENL